MRLWWPAVSAANGLIGETAVNLMGKISCLFQGHAWLAKVWEDSVFLRCERCDQVSRAEFDGEQPYVRPYFAGDQVARDAACSRDHKALASLPRTELEKVEEYILVLEKVLSERDRVIDAIPECPVHGRQCVPHALEWIQSQLQPTLQEELKCN